MCQVGLPWIIKAMDQLKIRRGDFEAQVTFFTISSNSVIGAKKVNVQNTCRVPFGHNL